MPGALVKRTSDWGRGCASGSVGPGHCPRLPPAGAQAWTVAGSTPVGRRGGPPEAPPAVSQRWGDAVAGGLLGGLGGRSPLTRTARGVAPACAPLGLRSGRTALSRLRSGQALERSLFAGTVAARVARPEWGGALQALLSLSPVARLHRHRERPCSVSCSRPRTRGLRSGQRLGALCSSRRATRQ
jgi:hypothetical protein